MLNRLVVPVDFSDQCSYALRYALLFNQRLGSAIEALHTWLVPDYILPLLVHPGEDAEGPLVNLANETAARELEQFLDASITQRPANLTSVIEFSAAASAIEEHAKRANAVVMGVHTKDIIERIWVGSVTESVLRTVHRPTFLIRKESQLPKKILVATDFSDASSLGLDLALGLTRVLDASVSIAHVVKPIPASTGLDLFLRAFDANLTGYADFSVERAQQTLQQFQGDRASDTVETHVASGDPAEELANLVDRGNFDLVVLATKADDTKGRRKIGRVARKVVRTIEVPLLFVPHGEPTN